MPHRKRSYANVAIRVDHARLDLVRDDPASGARQSVDAVDTVVDVDLPGAQHMPGHGTQSLRAVNLDWLLAAQYPWRKDQIRIPRRVVRMHVSQEDCLYAAGDRSQRCNPLIVCRRSTANDARAEVDEIRRAGHHDGRWGPRTRGIGTRRACAEHDDLTGRRWRGGRFRPDPRHPSVQL